MPQVSVRQRSMLMSHHRTNSMESSPQSSFVITTSTPNETYQQSPSSADPEFTSSTTTSTSSHQSKDKVASQPDQQLAKPVNFPSPSRSPESAVAASAAACAESNVEQLSGGTAATADNALVKKLQCKGASENGDAIQEGEASGSAAGDAIVSDEEVTSSTKKRARVETIVTNIIARDKLISQGVGGEKRFLSTGVQERCEMEKAKRNNIVKGINKRKSGMSAEEIVNLSAEQSATNELNEKFALNVLKGFSSNLATAGALNLVLAGQKHADSSSVSSAMYNYFAANNNNNNDEGEDEDEDTADGEMDEENGGWSSPTPKKARYDSNYRAAVRVTAISDNPSDEVECGNMMDYTILVDTLKRELMGAFEKVAEQSARRVLDRLVARKRTSQDGGKTSVKQRRDKSGSNSYNKEDTGQNCKRQQLDGGKKQEVSESKYRRQNHRRLNRNPELLSAKKRSNSEDQNKNHSANDDDDDNDDANSTKSSKTSTRSLDAEEQTDALSLVIKARSKSSGSSSPQQYKCHGRSVSPYESLSNNSERRKTSSGSTSNIKQNFDYEYSLVRAARGEKSSPVVAPNSASESDSGVEKNDEDRRSSAFWTPVKNDRLCNEGGTSPTAPSLQASLGLNSTSPVGASSSSAFAQRSFFQHLHHHPWQSNSLATALARQHQQQQQQQQYRNDSLVGDAPSLLWQARQTSDFKLNNSTLTSAAAVGSLKHSPSIQSQVPPFLGRSPIVPPFYLPLPVSATSQSPPIFSPSQLTFPLLQNFPQGAFVNALANSECRRIRTACDQSVGRSVAARTTTREPGKHRGDYSSATDDVSPYSAASIQEGLTPQHLKKAKLMFFYTRYPSANTLKTYFADVKFTRATTSQLIKWFSNFREFYYIQMEKFARQALTEGISEASQLQVSRNGELFRALNLHYNKSNEFRVPERFLDVTHTSLREFFMAIKTGKDHEPSWKKVIYKVICKLDQDIPELFKSSNVLDRLDEIID